VDAKKKTLGAVERNAVERLLFADLAQTLPVDQVVVVDESGSHLGMTTTYARAPRGERAYAQARRNYGANLSFISALRLSGMTAPFVVKGAVDSVVFEIYVGEVLAPTLRPGDIVIMDNLHCHQADPIRQLIEQRGAHLLFLPSYSPDLSPIEEAFAKVKAGLRRAKAATFDAYLDALHHTLESISKEDALNFFISCGYLNMR
jgi:transposase